MLNRRVRNISDTHILTKTLTVLTIPITTAFERTSVVFKGLQQFWWKLERAQLGVICSRFLR